MKIGDLVIVKEGPCEGMSCVLLGRCDDKNLSSMYWHVHYTPLCSSGILYESTLEVISESR
jgi:hypothetical protein